MKITCESLLNNEKDLKEHFEKIDIISKSFGGNINKSNQFLRESMVKIFGRIQGNRIISVINLDKRKIDHAFNLNLPHEEAI